jgi:hypothetical protein
MAVDQAPYDQRGNLQHFPETWRAEIDWRSNEPFTATLTLDGTRRGRSAAYFQWRDADGHTFPMFVSDTAALIEHSVIDHGTIRAAWIVGKRGQNYGLRYHGPADQELPEERL